MIFRFAIPGEPAPKGSRIVGVRKDGTRYTREASKRAGPWLIAASKSLWAQAQAQKAGFGEQPVKVTAVFLCQRPAKPTHQHPSRGDVDKLARLLLDSLTQSGVVTDDRHVVWLDVQKRYTDSEPRTVGRIEAAPGVRGAVVWPSEALAA